MTQLLQYINHDPVMTMTYFRARSTWVAYAFECVKLKTSFEGKKLSENWQVDRILIILKKRPQGFICPFIAATGILHNIRTRLLVYTADLR